jgi:hypothetical protein
MGLSLFPDANRGAHFREFEQLSDGERRALRRAIVERVPMSRDLTDDDFAALATASFRALDEEEMPGGPGARSLAI